MKRRPGDPALRWQRRFVAVVIGLVVLPSLALTLFGLLAVHNESAAARRRLFKTYKPVTNKLAAAVNQALEGMLAESGPALDALEAWARRRSAQPGKQLVNFCRRYQAVLPFVLDANGRQLLPRRQVPLPSWQGFPPAGFEELQRRELAEDKPLEAAAGYRRLLGALPADHPARCPLLAALARAEDRAGHLERALELHGQVAERCSSFVNAAGYNLGLGARLRQVELLKHLQTERFPAAVSSFGAELAFEGAWWRAAPDQVAFAASRMLELLEADAAGEAWLAQALRVLQQRRQVLRRLAQLRGLADNQARLLAVRVNQERYLVMLRGGETVTGLVLVPGGEVARTADQVLEELDLAGKLRARLLPSEQPCQEDCHQRLAGMAFLKSTELAWRLQLELANVGALDSLARSRSRLYLWLLVLVVLLLGGGIAWTIRAMLRESRLARLKTDFVSSVSHELRTPLTSIRMYTETLLLGRVGDEAERRECLQTIAQETERLSRLVERILDFSRLEKGRRAWHIENCPPRQLIEQAVAACRSQVEGNGMVIRYQLPEQLPDVPADRDAMVEVFINLIGNAVKYSPRGREIVIGGRRLDGYLEVWVRDQGIGIPRSEQRKIFEKFYRVDTPLASQVGGSGLGLSLVRYIVEAHGGSVTVGSLPGQGSTFTVRLPLGGAGTGDEPVAEDKP